VWDWRFSKLLLANYLVFEGIYLLYYHAGRKALLSQMIALKAKNKTLICFSLFIITLAVFSLINDLEMLYNNRNRYYIWSYAILFLLSFCGNLHLICFAKKSKKYEIRKILNTGSLSLFIFVLLSMCAGLFVQFNWKSPVFSLMSTVFMILTLSGLSSPLSRFSQNKKLQQLDWLEKIYRFMFVSLLQNIGRILWLIIDWKLVEKFVTETILKIWQTSLRIFRIIQNSLFWRFFFIAVIILVILALTPYIKEIK
jgi:MFS family permease